ncbi:MAG: ATP-binding cassette domain-containing protein [Deltaproteobacteria bacterium]|jgi:ABC-type nitrate/sulfonate/bicarbonate transport system ATPase subunit|nr:ATP-binding cassette domain-containing protein [Deltaproteobacteria bacterium]
MPLLRAFRIAKSHAGAPVIADASLSLRAGTVTLLSAPSGTGKSTLLEILAGVQDPDRGTVERKAPASLMFQDNALIPWLGAAANLAYILPPSLPAAEREERISRFLEIFELAGKTRPPAMSSGMKRRLGLARAFAADRAITLLDEPFAFLDDRWRRAAASLIRGKAEAGGAVALAGHQADPALLDSCPDLLRVLELGPAPVRLADPEARGEGGGAPDDGAEPS